MMRAITLHQPWASLIAEGVKTTETRSWSPPGWLLGDRIAIHAAKRAPSQLFPITDGETYGFLNVKDMPRGKVVATARLAGAGKVLDYQSDLEEGHVWVKEQYVASAIKTDPYGDYSVGRWIWFLEDIRKLDKPIPAKGMQRIWQLPPDIAEQLA